MLHKIGYDRLIHLTKYSLWILKVTATNWPQQGRTGIGPRATRRHMVVKS